MGCQNAALVRPLYSNLNQKSRGFLPRSLLLVFRVPGASAIRLFQRDVQRADQRHQITDELPAAELGQRLEVGEGRGPEMATIGGSRAVAHQIETDLPARPFDAVIGLSRGPGVER